MKNQNVEANNRPEGASGVLSGPCWRTEAVANHKLFNRLNSFPGSSSDWRALARYPKGVKKSMTHIMTVINNTCNEP